MINQVFNYDVTKFSWHTPLTIFKAYDILQARYDQELGKKREFQNLTEAIPVAIVLVGLYKIQNISYYMQICRDRFPDIVTMRPTQGKNPVFGEFSDVEVVRFDNFTDIIDIVEFLKNTKLSKQKSYPANTIIVCDIGKSIKIDYEKIRKELRKASPAHEIYLVGKIHPSQQIYQIFQAFPSRLSPIIVNASKDAEGIPDPQSLMLYLSSKKTIEYRKTIKRSENALEIFDIHL